MIDYKNFNKSFFLFAGPCVIEDENMINKTAEMIKKIADELNIIFVFKSSYDKANRTSLDSFRGPGMEKGLKILLNLKKNLKIPLLIDVHCKHDVKRVAEVADIIQIPAFLCRQTDLIIEAGKSGLPVNVKKGQFLSPESVKFIVEKLESVGCRNVFITERGTSFGYGRLIVDFTGIPVMKKLGYPIVFDATHSVQMPSTGKPKTGGMRDVIPSLLYSAISSGVNGVFMEVHPQPEHALSDMASQYPLAGLKEVMIKAKKIYNVIND